MHRRLIVAGALLLGVAVSGCAAIGVAPPTQGSIVASVPASAPGAPTPASRAGPSRSAAPAAAAEPTSGARHASAPAVPPSATLRGLVAAGGATGALGGYTWGGSGSAAPWIVGRPTGAVHAGGALSVELDGWTPASWAVAWTRVERGAAGAPAVTSRGTGDPRLIAPVETGDWTIRLTASGGPGCTAAWYWRLAVVP